MKRFLLAATAAVALLTAQGVRADELRCGAPTVFHGDDTRSLPVVEVNISYNPEMHTWSVLHRLADGTVVQRAQQYAMRDRTGNLDLGTGLAGWEGSLNRNRSLYMIGEVNEHGYYQEWLYDENKGNREVMHMGVQCQYFRPLPPTPPQVKYVPAPPAPAPVAAPAAPAPTSPVVVAPVIVMPPSYQQAPQVQAPVQAQAPAPVQQAPAPKAEPETAAPATSPSLASLPPDKVAIIKNYCADRYPTNFEMREYCENNQLESLRNLIRRGSIKPTGDEL